MRVTLKSGQGITGVNVKLSVQQMIALKDQWDRVKDIVNPESEKDRQEVETLNMFFHKVCGEIESTKEAHDEVFGLDLEEVGKLELQRL